MVSAQVDVPDLIKQFYLLLDSSLQAERSLLLVLWHGVLLGCLCGSRSSRGCPMIVEQCCSAVTDYVKVPVLGEERSQGLW
jgi:hypothetical protein